MSSQKEDIVDPSHLDPRLPSCIEQRKKIKIAVGLSGGVDSSLSLLLLKKMSFDIIGIHMNNWDPFDEQSQVGSCTTQQDAVDAETICKQLDIPFHQVDFVKEYWLNVFSPSLEVWRRGGTPNPDVLCNREIKFKMFHQVAKERFGADFIATGHYCRKQITPSGEAKLLRGVDRGKDQSYFLCQISQQSLQDTLFPIGALQKSYVREIALRNNLKTAKKKDSVGLCFVGNRKNFSSFLSQYLEEREGPIVEIQTNKIVGQHSGLYSKTIGERARISGLSNPLFVCEKDIPTNTLYVCESEDPSLWRSSFLAINPVWVSGSPPPSLHISDPSLSSSSSFEMMHHYPSSPQPCHFTEHSLSSFKLAHRPFPLSYCKGSQYNEEERENKGIVVKTERKERGVTPGQFVAFFEGEECLGGAVVAPLDRVKKKEKNPQETKETRRKFSKKERKIVYKF